jgi:ribonuclease HI
VIKQKYYVVWKGRKTGIFTSWAECEKQVKGFVGAQYKAFDSNKEADAAFLAKYDDYKGKAASHGKWKTADSQPILPSICVDAACSGSPGKVEFRGVITNTGEQIFHAGPYDHGTNNVGEFLAVVHALAKLKEDQLDWPVYSDSGTALAWLKNRRAKTELERNKKNKELFNLLDRAEKWLNEHTYINPVLKWDTEVWGENPADFGRK